MADHRKALPRNDFRRVYYRRAIPLKNTPAIPFAVDAGCRRRSPCLFYMPQGGDGGGKTEEEKKEIHTSYSVVLRIRRYRPDFRNRDISGHTRFGACRTPGAYGRTCLSYRRPERFL
jgi:hypothetical protein